VLSWQSSFILTHTTEVSGLTLYMYHTRMPYGFCRQIRHGRSRLTTGYITVEKHSVLYIGRSSATMVETMITLSLVSESSIVLRCDMMARQLLQLTASPVCMLLGFVRWSNLTATTFVSALRHFFCSPFSAPDQPCSRHTINSSRYSVQYRVIYDQPALHLCIT